MTDIKVTGPRSPRWSFLGRTRIPCLDGRPYLFRLRIVQTPLFGIFLHDIFEPDGDRDPHNHPWAFVSIVLRGSYTEVLYPRPERSKAYRKTQTWRRWSIHRMGMDSAHRIVRAEPGLKTLILTGPRRSGWGFFTPEGYVRWQDYVEARDAR